MKVRSTGIAGLLIADAAPAIDDRGHFARWFDAASFAEHGYEIDITTAGSSWNEHLHTLRGLHYQLPPVGEMKVIRCSSGAVHDVIVDVRPDSPTFGAIEAFSLVAGDGHVLAVPEGCAHGFLTMTAGTEVTYLLSGRVDPIAARGIRWDDPVLQHEWPAEPMVLSDRDRAWPNVSWESLESTL